jgi:hypothetical protein
MAALPQGTTCYLASAGLVTTITSRSHPSTDEVPARERHAAAMSHRAHNSAVCLVDAQDEV